MINVGVGLLIAALPYLISGIAQAGDFPPILAYLLFPGRGVLVLLGAIVVSWAVLRDRPWLSARASDIEGMARHRGFALVALALVSVLALARVPQEEKEAEAFGGDEPKYLRIAFSLLRDTDADISGGRTQTPGLAVRIQQVRNLVLVGRDSAASLFQPLNIPKDHVWNATNWTVNGLHGGLYHLQPPGLPALVAIALGVGEALLPERDPGIYVAVLLSLIWILAARELWLLGAELRQDSLTTFLLVAIVFLSAPVFVGGYQLFPESLSLWLFPWLVRRLRASSRHLGPGGAIACGALTGYLLWIHPKLTVVAVLFATMGLVRPLTSQREKAVFTLGFAVVAFTSLLYCYHISGLFRPEGLYIRQAEEYVGSPDPFSLRFAAGLVKSLLGGRDGLLVFAPVLILGFVNPKVVTLPSRTTIEMWSLFVIVWLTSAVHDGASLGSPARLMAPVVFVPAFFLVRALREGNNASLLSGAMFLFLIGSKVTATVASDWRRNVNPYRTMFANPATNFEPSLPGNSFSDLVYRSDLEKAALILLAFGLLGALLRRGEKRDSTFAPARFGAGVVTFAVVAAIGLNWLSPP